MGFKALENLVLKVPMSIFGTTVTYTPSGDAAIEIKGIFDYKYIEVLNTQSLMPILTVNLNDFNQDPKKGDTVAIDDVSFRVLESRKDGLSAAVLILQRV